MAVTLTGTAGYWVRIGALAGEINRVCTAFGSALNTGTSGISAQFASNDQIVIDQLFSTREIYRNVHGNYLSYLRNAAVNTTIEQVNRDTTLSSKTLYNALVELIRQMDGTVDSLNRPTISTTVTTGSANAGDTVVFASTTNEKGVPLDMVLPETLTIVCTNDVNSGGTQYAEPLSLTGQPVRAFDAYNWPGGSGASTALNVTDGGSTTKVSGSYQNWGGTGNNVIQDWTIVAGTSGTHIFRGSSPYRSSQSYSLQFTSDGSVLPCLRQAVTLLPNRVYSWTNFAKINTLDATGAIRYRLCDGSGTTITDDATTGNTYSRDVNGQTTTSFSRHQTFFRTPRQMPAQTFMEVALTTAPTTGRVLHFSLPALVECTQSYQGGPFVVAFSGIDYTTRLDSWTIAVANNLSTTAFIPTVDRLFNLRQLGLAFTSAVSETISDSLIA